MKQNLFNFSIIITIFLGLLRPTHSLDFFFFNRFYNDGTCKSVLELSKYMIQGKSEHESVSTENLKRDELVTIQLFREDAEPINFGIVFSDSNKKSLWSANEFFHDIQTNGDEYERSIFPDLISCIEDRSMIYSFGLWDSYGLMYALAPTMFQYQNNYLNKMYYSFLDVVNIYLDVFKAYQVLLKKEYFLKTFDERDVGITRVVNGPNVMIKGKIRQLHNIRKSKISCKPNEMSIYPQMVKMFERSNQRDNWTRNISMYHYEVCHIVNLYQIWLQMIEKFTVNIMIESGIQLMFDECLYGSIPREQCPSEFDYLWDSQFHQQILHKFMYSALRYQPLSIADYLIEMLDSLKTDYLEKKVRHQLDELSDKSKRRHQLIKTVHEDEQKMEKLDSDIMKLVPEQRKQDLNLVLEEKQKEVQAQLDAQTGEKKPVHQLNLILEDPMMDMDVEKKVLDMIAPEQKSQAEKLLNEKDVVHTQEMSIIFKEEKEILKVKKTVEIQIDEIKKKMTKNAEDMFKISKQSENELKLIQLVRESDGKSISDIMKENKELAAKVRQEWERKGVKFSALTLAEVAQMEENKKAKELGTINKIIKKSSEQSDQMENNSVDSSSFNHDDISEQLSLESIDLLNMNNQDLLGKRITEDFERDELDLEGLTLDLDEEENLFNDTFLRDLHAETIPSEAEKKIKKNYNFDVNFETIKKEKDEDTMLINYQKAGKIDEAMALKHALKNAIINEYSLEANERSQQKLEEIEFILQKKKELIELKKDNSDGKNDETINTIEIMINSKIGGIYSGFGELENIGISKVGVKTISLWEFGEDFSEVELKMVKGVTHLEELPSVDRLLI